MRHSGDTGQERLLASLPDLAVDDLDAVVAGVLAGLPWADSASVLLADYSETVLIPLTRDARRYRDAEVPVEGSMAGLSFTRQEPVADSDGRGVWVPLTNRWRRLGAVHVVGHDVLDEEQVARAQHAVGLLAMIIDGASRATDAFARARRLAPLSLTAEMQWELLPQLCIATSGVTIAGRLEPAYEVGGDSFDYAINGRRAYFAIFDPLGHDLRSALLSTLAVGAYRNARREGTPLAGIGPVLDQVVRGAFPDCFVTGLLCELDMDSGALSVVNAGHEPPLILRDGHVRQLSMTPARPWGMYHEDGTSGPPVVAERLQPGDRIVLFTDGVTEARGDRGVPFGIKGLSDHLIRESAAPHVAVELLRRVLDAATSKARPHDDATVVLAEWRGPAAVPTLGG